jgi:allantoate deiminase
MAPGQKLMKRLHDFARFTDEPRAMTRLYLSPAHRLAVDDLMIQLRNLGMEPWLDGIGNVQARYAGTDPAAPSVMIGSHCDTVRNAGIYDGNLGVFAALGVIEQLALRGERLRCPIDFIAFGDEEGVRFPSTLGGSRAIAGTLNMTALDLQDEDGISLHEALRQFGCDTSVIPALARQKGSVKAFLEMHIEQGPVLEAENLPLGIVSAISGATRAMITLTGLAGHAGTVPMALRQDALAAAAEMIVLVETIARTNAGLVATVGKIEAKPGAVNVISGETVFTLDLRSAEDALRIEAVEAIREGFQDIARRRGIGMAFTKAHDADAVLCDPQVLNALEAAMDEAGHKQRQLPSGAGHDAMTMAALCPVGMLFVRCKGGISHHPLESITLEDAEAAMAVFEKAVRRLAQ